MEDVRCVIVESIEAKISESGYIQRSPLDSPLQIHPRPCSTLSSTTFSDPYRDRKVGINVNRMSARPRKTALQWCIKGSLFHSGLLAISTSENSSFSRHGRIFFELYSFPSFLVSCQAQAKPHCYSIRRVHLKPLRNAFRPPRGNLATKRITPHPQRQFRFRPLLIRPN